MRRQFDLPLADVQYLNTLGLNWETVKEGSTHWLLIHQRAVPSGYTASHAQVALQIPPGYPDSPLDMVYFYPALERMDGQVIGAAIQLTNGVPQFPFDGKPFQRWSRHRTDKAPWRPGEDDISSHLVLVDDWLEREFRIR